MTEAGIVVRGDGKKKWFLKKCKACKGNGRQKLTQDQSKFWEYDSVSCPECEGAGFKKEITYFHNIGDVVQ